MTTEPQGAQGTEFQAEVGRAEFRINTTTRSNQRDPSVTALSDGGFVVVWKGAGSDGYGVYGQRFLPPESGIPKGDVGTVTVAIDGSSDTAIGQSGTGTIRQDGNGQWHHVTFDTTIENAIVVLEPVAHNGTDPLTTHVRNVTDTGFEF